jgi:alpha-beta hydrolase superfamily lysophospholipase
MNAVKPQITQMDAERVAMVLSKTRWTGLIAWSVCVLAAPLGSQSGTQVREETIRLRAEDGGGLFAIYHQPAGRSPKVAFLFMHPRGGNVTHFALEPLAGRGFGALGMGSRSMNRTGIHEELVLDVAAGVKFLKSRGIERVILVGHSGGGSLMAFYQSQAETPPPRRVKGTPAGDPPDLNTFDLPKADGLVTLNAAEGEGLHFTHHLDPSLTDERDPFSYDASLDIYNPDNGFRVPPGKTTYAPAFVERVGKAQQERGRRLAELARSYVRSQNYYRDLMTSPAFQHLSLKDQLMIERRARFDHPMVLYRTRADLRYYDLSLDASDREVGHMTGPVKDGHRRSDLRNWEYDDPLSTGITAREFLSTLSVESHARMWDNLGKISVPVLVVNSSADSGIHRSEHERTFDSVASRDKERLWIVGGEHGLEPHGPKGGRGDQRAQFIDAVTKWATKRWGQPGPSIDD